MREVVDIGGSRTTTQGITVEVELLYRDDPPEVVLIQSGTLPKISAKLKKVMVDAHRARLSLAIPDPMVNPFLIRGLSACTPSVDGQMVILQLELTDGSPFQLAIPTGPSARNLLDTLATVLDTAESLAARKQSGSH